MRRTAPLLLAIDIGNTTVQMGLFDGATLCGSWRLLSSAPRTYDEWGMLLTVQFQRLERAPAEVAGVIISSVVPGLSRIFEEMCHAYLDRQPLFVDATLDLGLEIAYEDPAAVGADRLCVAVAGTHKYGAPLVIIDFGTATTFDVVDGDGRYAGGVIAPGIETASAELHRRAAKLPQVAPAFPARVIGTTTEASIQSGIMFGAVSEVEGLVARIRDELGSPAPVVATGGLAAVIGPRCPAIDHVEPDLILEGLRLVYHRVREKAQ